MRIHWHRVSLVAIATLSPMAVVAVAFLSAPQNLSSITRIQALASSSIDSAIRHENFRIASADLTKGTGLWTRLQPFSPLAGALVALLALAGTTFQYLRDRRRERDLRIEEGIAGATNTLTAFPGDQEAGIGTIVAALRNLRGFIDRSTYPQDLEAQMTDILAAVIREDLDYRNARHARFDILCFQYWDAYRRHQIKNPRENLYILDQYIEALDDLEQRTGIVGTATFGAGGVRNISEDVPNAVITHLNRLVTGYGLRLSLLPSDEAQISEQRFFRIARGNESLRDRMLSSRQGR
jgi:hypothetical protein